MDLDPTRFVKPLSAPEPVETPPENSIPLEVLPGVMIAVEHSEDFNPAEGFEDWDFPLIVAAAPVVGDSLETNDGKHTAEVVRRCFATHPDFGPYIRLAVRSE